MARIRTIKPEFWASEQVMECSPMARLLFIGLWNFCDDGGNHVDSDKTIKAEIFPGDDISSTDVRRMIDELSSNGLLELYTSNGKGFIHVTGWKHQKIDRPSFKHPAFPGDASSNDRRMIGDNSPPEGKGREGKGKNPPNPPDSAGGKPRKSERIGYTAFVQACRDAGDHPIPADDPIFGFAHDARIPREFIALAWRAFAAKHRSGRKQQAGIVGWRAHFRDAVRGNWAKLWYFPKDGDEAALTTVGIALIRERDAEQARKAEQQEAA